MSPSITQIAIVVLIVMILFGAGRIPSIMENMAKGINSFKKGLKDDGTSGGEAAERKQDDHKDE